MQAGRGIKIQLSSTKLHSDGCCRSERGSVGHVSVIIINIAVTVSRDTMPDALLLVTTIFAVLHVTSGLTNISVGAVACLLSDTLRAHVVTPVWSGICVSTV